MQATVTFYRGHRRTLCCLPGIISSPQLPRVLLLITSSFSDCCSFFDIKTVVNYTQRLLFRRWSRLTGPRLGLNSKPWPQCTSHSTAHGTQVIRPLDYTGRPSHSQHIGLAVITQSRMLADAQRDGCPIGGAVCESSLIAFLVPHHKVWLMSTARVPCSNAANIG